MVTQLFNADVPIYETRRFCTNARVNWAENMLLGHPLARSKEHTAVVTLIEPASTKGTRKQQLEEAFIQSFTFDELYLAVAQAASGLAKLGVRQGDRVAAVTCNNAGKFNSFGSLPVSDITLDFASSQKPSSWFSPQLP